MKAWQVSRNLGHGKPDKLEICFPLNTQSELCDTIFLDVKHTIGLGLFASKYNRANDFDGKGWKSVLLVGICTNSPAFETKGSI